MTSVVARLVRRSDRDHAAVIRTEIVTAAAELQPAELEALLVAVRALVDAELRAIRRRRRSRRAYSF